MVTGKRRRTGSKEAPDEPSSRIERDYVAEVQSRVAELTYTTENADLSAGVPTLAFKRRRRVEKEMASLRAEALKARRLAERIENLSYEKDRHKGKKKMTGTPTTEPEVLAGQNRRKTDTSKSAGSQMSFNPLHPSMELPPEQLIRLLGLETKKIRKGRSTGGHSQEKRKPASVQSRESLDSKSGSAQVATLIPPISRNASVSNHKDETRRTGLLFPAAMTGVVAGFALAGYLFWSKPPVTKTQILTQEQAAEKLSDKSSAATRGATLTPQQSGAKSQPVRSATAQPEKRKMETSQLPATPTASTDTIDNVDPARQAAIDTELARLHQEAEQRFAAEISRIEAERELLESQPSVITETNQSAVPDTTRPAGKIQTVTSQETINTPSAASEITRSPDAETIRESGFSDANRGDITQPSADPLTYGREAAPEREGVQVDPTDQQGIIIRQQHSEASAGTDTGATSFDRDLSDEDALEAQ